jgi:hypothetical protein
VEWIEGGVEERKEGVKTDASKKFSVQPFTKGWRGYGGRAPMAANFHAPAIDKKHGEAMKKEVPRRDDSQIAPANRGKNKVV